MNMFRSNPPPAIVTTSWDDGHALDVRLADLLCRKGITGTFYIPARARYRELSDADVATLASRFEIGAHSLTHPNLTLLDTGSRWEEIKGAKDYIEGITHAPCALYCYPGGKYDDQVIALVRQAGFIGARTTHSLHDGRVANPYLLRTTLQACTHSKARTKVSTTGHADGSIAPLLRLNALRENPPGCYDWRQLACATFDIIRAAGGVWYLWGHSWEVELCDLWDALEVTLDYVSSCGIVSVTNGELVRALQGPVH